MAVASDYVGLGFHLTSHGADIIVHPARTTLETFAGSSQVIHTELAVG